MSILRQRRHVRFELPPLPPQSAESPSLPVSLDNHPPAAFHPTKCLSSCNPDSPNTLVDMIASSFLPSRFRGAQRTSEAVSAPSWINKKVTPVLQTLSTVTSS